MQPIDLSKAVLQKVQIAEFSDRNISFFIQRDDLIHPGVSGNKWRKLKYNIELAKSKSKEGILTFGGAYSNHILATAFACSQLGLKSIGIIRGDELNKQSNDTLRRASEIGMELIFVSRTEYSERCKYDYLNNLSAQFSSFQIVPEGGANYHGLIGCQEIVETFPKETSHVFVAQGTTTTSCGVLLGLPSNSQLNVVPVLKNFDSLSEMSTLFQKSGFDSEFIEDKLEQVNIRSNFHFGGYGKWNEKLINFIRTFYKQTEIKLDPIYTGKAMFALFEEVKTGKLNDSTVIFIHTGGLQGISGVENRLGELIF